MDRFGSVSGRKAKHDCSHSPSVGKQCEQVLIVASGAGVEALGVGLANKMLHRGQEDLDSWAELREVFVISSATSENGLAGAHAAEHCDWCTTSFERKEPHTPAV